MLVETTMFEPRILLHGVTWDTYERLVEEIHNPGVRLTYDRGELEVLTVRTCTSAGRSCSAA